MKFWLKMGLLFALAYAVFMVLTLPMAWLAPQVLPDELAQLEQVEGTLWQGSAGELEVDGLILTDLRWRFEPAALLKGQLAWQLRADGDLRLRGRAGVGLSGGFAEQVLLDAPAELIASYLRLPVPVLLQGEMTLAVRQWQQGTGLCQVLEGDMNWVDAAGSSFGQRLVLGDLNASLACEQGAVLADVSGIGGQLIPTLQARVQPSGQLTVDGKLAPTAGLPNNLRSALGMLGRPDSQGHWTIKINQRVF